MARRASRWLTVVASAIGGRDGASCPWRSRVRAARAAPRGVGAAAARSRRGSRDPGSRRPGPTRARRRPPPAARPPRTARRRRRAPPRRRCAEPSPTFTPHAPPLPPPTPEQLAAYEAMRQEADAYAGRRDDYKDTITTIITLHYEEKKKAILGGLDREIGIEKDELKKARETAIKRLEDFVAKYSGVQRAARGDARRDVPPRGALRGARAQRRRSERRPRA